MRAVLHTPSFRAFPIPSHTNVVFWLRICTTHSSSHLLHIIEFYCFHMFHETTAHRKLRKNIANITAFEQISRLSSVFRSICNKHADDAMMTCVLSKEQKKEQEQKKSNNAQYLAKA